MKKIARKCRFWKEPGPGHLLLYEWVQSYQSAQYPNVLVTSGRLPMGGKSKNIMGGSEAGKWHMGMGMAKLKLINNLYSVLNPSTSHRNESAIANTGASGNYLKTDAPHDIEIRPVAPIQVKQPTGKILQSTKVCRLELATLPEGYREAHTPPGLPHSSLISIGKLCDSGCEASFNQNKMTVTKYKHVVLQGTRDVMKGLRIVPLHSLDRPTY